jgi:hypothetical protein
MMERKKSSMTGSSSDDHGDDEDDGIKPERGAANATTSIESGRPNLPRVLDEIIAAGSSQHATGRKRALAVGGQSFFFLGSDD